MSDETIKAIFTFLTVIVTTYSTYRLVKQADAKRAQETKTDTSEYGKGYVDDLILQLRSRIEECTQRVESLEQQIVDLKEQVTSKTQQVSRAENERDTAIQGNKSIEAFVDLLMTALEKRLPLTVSIPPGDKPS